MRQGVVQVARDLQALAHHGGITRLFRQSFDFAGPRRHALIQFGIQGLQCAAFTLQRSEQLVQCTSQPRRFIPAGRHGDSLRGTGSDGIGRARDGIQVACDAACQQHAEQRGEQSQAKQDGGDLTLQDSRALRGVLQWLQHHDAPAQSVQGIGRCRRCARDQIAPAIGQPFDTRGPFNAAPWHIARYYRCGSVGRFKGALPALAFKARGPDQHRAILVQQQRFGTGRPSQLLPKTAREIQQPARAQLRPDYADVVSLGVDHRGDSGLRRAEVHRRLRRAASSPPLAPVAHRRFSTPSDPAQTTTGRQRSRPPPRRGWRPVPDLAGSPRRSTRIRGKPVAGSRESCAASPGFRRGAQWPASQPRHAPIAVEAQD